MDDAALASAPTPSAASRMLTPLDIQQKEFRVATRGYKMRDVDEFLDQLTDAMSAVLAENERLRTGSPASPAIGTADLDDTNRQADEIIQRARNEAARIVADARAQAAVGAGTGTNQAAVAAFLAQERDFLQSLAGLVQGHAESVKGMAKAARQAPAASAPTATSAASPATQTKAAGAEPAKAKTPEPAKAGTEPAAATNEPPAAAPASEETVRLQQPEPASVGRAEPTEPAEGDSSLRELFWGED